MVRRDIELCEIVLVVFDFRTFDHLIAHSDKDSLDFLKRDRIRMTVSHLLLLRGKRHIDGLGGKACVQPLRLETGFCLLQTRLDMSACVIHPFSDHRTLFLRHVLHSFQDLGQRAFLSEYGDTDFIETLHRVGTADFLCRLLLNLPNLVLCLTHVCPPCQAG